MCGIWVDICAVCLRGRGIWVLGLLKELGIVEAGEVPGLEGDGLWEGGWLVVIGDDVRGDRWMDRACGVDGGFCDFSEVH